MTYCTGGTVTYAGGKRIHTFTSSGSLVVLAPGMVQYLVVAGGGSGGYSDGHYGGGGGAGGMLEDYLYLTGGSKTVTIGSSDQNSVFATVTATAGGVGADASLHAVGGSGGSGGGGAENSGGSGIAGPPRQGYDGGQGGWNNGGGGGGAGGAGYYGGPDYWGAGGPGKSSSISGSAVTYAAGGHGAASGGAGAANTGNGGASGPLSFNPGYAGGSGIVIVSYVVSGRWTPTAFYKAQDVIAGAGGIASAEAFGSNDGVGSSVSLAGSITSLEAFGSPGTTISGQTVSGAGGIASDETFGDYGHLWYVGIAMDEELVTWVYDSVTETVNVYTEKIG